MTDFNRDIGVAFGAQSAEGTADPTIAALAGTVDLSEGAILGDPASGISESGLTHNFTRRESEPIEVAGSFTLGGSNFLEEQISTFTFAFPLSGNKADTVGGPADSDFDQDQGINDLFAACGLVGAASGAPGFDYTPADTEIATAKIFDSGFAWVIRDIRGSMSISQVPGEVGIVTVTLQGIVDSGALIAFPTFDYGVQATVASPSVKEANPIWGGAVVRGWTDLTIDINNDIASVPDSASSTGNVFEQNGREIIISMNIRDDTGDVDFSREHLINPVAPTDDLTAQIGAAAGAGEAALAYEYDLTNLQVITYNPDVAGRKAASNVTARCTGDGTDGSEFRLSFF